MTAEIVRHEPSLIEKQEWSRAMAPSGLLPRQYQNNPANLLFAVEYADALGVERIHAITSIHVIEGKPSASADLIAATVRRAGHKLRVSGDDTHAVAQLIRADDPEFTYEARWDMGKARAAGLAGKGVWKNYPGAMLRSRAITEVARMGASDALFGVIYTPEELGAEIDPQGQVVHQVTTVQQQPSSGVERMQQMLGGGEPPTSPAPAAEEPQVEGITDAQVKKLATTMSKAGLADREAALQYVAGVIGRTVESRNDLTKAEASKVIDSLEHEPVDAEIVEDPEPAEETPPDVSMDEGDRVWNQILQETEKRGMSVQDTANDFSATTGGLIASEASAGELRVYLDRLLEVTPERVDA